MNGCCSALNPCGAVLANTLTSPSLASLIFTGRSSEQIRLEGGCWEGRRVRLREGTGVSWDVHKHLSPPSQVSFQRPHPGGRDTLSGFSEPAVLIPSCPCLKLSALVRCCRSPMGRQLHAPWLSAVICDSLSEPLDSLALLQPHLCVNKFLCPYFSSEMCLKQHCPAELPEMVEMFRICGV